MQLPLSHLVRPSVEGIAQRGRIQEAAEDSKEREKIHDVMRNQSATERQWLANAQQRSFKQLATL